MRDLKKDRFLYIPHVAVLFHALGMTYGLAVHSPYTRSPFFYGTLFFSALSLFIMKYRRDRSGVHTFLLSAFVAVLNYQIMSIKHAHSYVVDYAFFILLVVLSVFLLEIPQSIYFVILIGTLMLLKINYICRISSEDIIILIITTLFIAIILFEAKRWIARLNDHQIGSMRKLHNKTLHILGKVCEIKDQETSDHLHRVEIMVGQLVTYLMHQKQYTHYLTPKYREDIESAAYLHDIGKIAISDKILNKPGKLTADEYAVIQTHTTIGYDLLAEAQRNIADESIFDLAMEIARHHHEKWDGTGYPDQLKGEEIPLSARIMAIVDVYDALISKRPYKEPFSHQDAVKIIKDGSGNHFDPVIARAFILHSERIRRLIEMHME